MCACTLIQCQPALHACTLLQWGVHAHALLVQLPMQIFLPPDILQPTFPEGHVPRELAVREGLGEACACWLTSLQGGAVSNLAMIRARVRQAVLAHSSVV